MLKSLVLEGLHTKGMNLRTYKGLEYVQEGGGETCLLNLCTKSTFLLFNTTKSFKISTRDVRVHSRLGVMEGECEQNLAITSLK